MVGLVAVHAWSGAYTGDFFDHAAAVRELAARPWQPMHPALVVQATHAFFSPYHLAVGLVARVTGISAARVLGWAGVVNVVLLMAALRRLMKAVRKEEAWPLGVAFVAFLWGAGGWQWSGFYQWWIIGEVAPYPSTFAAAMAFFALACAIEGKGLAQFVMCAAVATLCHPTTAMCLFACVGVTWPRFWLASVGAIALALLWPYFSLVSLMTGQSADFNSQSADLFQGVLRYTWPTLLMVPVALRGNTRLMRYAAVLAAVYLLGMIAVPGVGRAVSWACVFVQLSAAVAIVEARSRVWEVAAAGACVVFAVSGPSVRKPLAYEQEWKKLRSVLAAVGERDVVMTDLYTASQVTAITGRVVATYTPQYWVPDLKERRAAVEAYPSASSEEKEEIARKYRVRWWLKNSSLVRVGE